MAQIRNVSGIVLYAAVSYGSPQHRRVDVGQVIEVPEGESIHYTASSDWEAADAPAQAAHEAEVAEVAVREEAELETRFGYVEPEEALSPVDDAGQPAVGSESAGE